MNAILHESLFCFLHNSWMQKSFEKFCFGGEKKKTRMQIIVQKCKCKYSYLCETGAYTKHSQLIKFNDVFLKNHQNQN